MQLRDYQQALAEDIRNAYRAGRKAPLAVAPTGAGKTVLFSFIARGAAAKGKTVWILVHRQELLDQTARTLREVGVTHGLIAAGRTPNPLEPVQVAGVQTLVRRKVTRAPDLIILDECHHAIAGSWRKIIATYPNARLLGVTATPERLDGKGLGDIFDAMVRGPEVRDLIRQGYLCPPVYYAPPCQLDMRGVHSRGGDFARDEVTAKVDKPTITGDAVEHYRRICPGQPAIAFCASIRHAEHVADTFKVAGFRAGVIDGTMTADERRDRVRALGDGRLHVMTSCEIVSEGFDLPVCSAAILLRPTQSLSLHLQQIGRVLRVAPNKPRAYILDHVGNLHRHGLAEDIRDWSLEGDAGRRKAKEKPTIPVRQCPECYCCHPPAPDCPQCGHTYEIQAREIEQVAGTLQIASDIIDEHRRRCHCGNVHSRWDATCPACGQVLDARKLAKREQGQAQTYADLVRIGNARGYKNPAAWARYILAARQKRRASA
jgi:superfamily II DNA or RNA helicase